MTWFAVGSAAVSVVGGAIASNQAKKGAQGAANAQLQGQQLTIDEQRRQYDQTRTDQMPWLQAGSGALTQMQALNSGDFSSFKASPDYQFALQQGQQGLDRGAAARGSLYSGGHTADTINYGQGMAAQQYGNYYARLQSMAGQGQTTAGNLGSMGAAMAGQVGNAYGRMGDARASAYNANANANSQFATGALGAFNYGLNQWGAQRAAQNGGTNGPAIQGWFGQNNPKLGGRSGTGPY